MSDLIERQAAINTHCELCGDRDKCNCDICPDVEVFRLIPSAQPEQRWIPVSERLPKQGQEVICQCRASIIKVLKLDANGDWYQDANHRYMGGFAIAWMPLPESYSGE